MKINYWGFIVCLVLFLGLINPWVSKGSEPYSTVNPSTGQGELKFYRIIRLSPFFASVYEDNQLVDRMWFVSPGLTFSGVILMSVALLSVINYQQTWVNFVLFLISVLSIVIFFMSLGMGQALGLRSQLEWGATVSLGGVILLLLLSVSKLLRHPGVRM
jgi:uncharacterized membrane protein SirB2